MPLIQYTDLGAGLGGAGRLQGTGDSVGGQGWLAGRTLGVSCA